MLALGLDTSSPAVTCALVRLTDDGDEVLGESVVVDARRHGELLAQGVQSVLGEVPATALAAVVVGLGPGPFTGLRVGLMTGAAMADALGVPVYGECSLDAMAPQGPVVVVADARRKEVYWARYDDAGTRVEGPSVSRPAELAPRLVPGSRLVGAGAVLHRDAFPGFVVDDGPLHPSAVALVRLADDRVRAGAASDPLTPLYLRRPDAVEPGVAKRVTA